MNHKTILTIAAHPDDEILGCGATMAKLSEEGHEVHVLILAEGLTSRQNIRDREIKKNELSELARSAHEASNIVGSKSIELLDFPDNRMDSIDLLDIVKVLESKINSLKPDIIFTHFHGDLNIDHRITSEAVITAIRPIPGQCVKEIYFFEVPSSTDYQIYYNGNNFTPNVYFSVSQNQIERKVKALEAYKSEMREFPHSRSNESIQYLAKLRGSQVGYPYAESFMLGRKIIC